MERQKAFIVGLHAMRKKIKVIDIETLELFESITDCARTLGVTVGGLYNNILIGCKTKGRRLDFFEDWRYLTPKQKEKHTRKNNIFFL